MAREVAESSDARFTTEASLASPSIHDWRGIGRWQDGNRACERNIHARLLLPRSIRTKVCKQNSRLIRSWHGSREMVAPQSGTETKEDQENGNAGKENEC